MSLKPLWFVVWALVLSQPTLGEAEALDRPNVLWLTSEDNSAHWLGCYGNEHAQTPNLDQLARDGFQYMHAYANAPVCAPSRSTWITGVLAVSTGTHPMRSNYRIPHDTIRFYPDYLREAGYYTGNWNKMDYNIGGRPWEACWDSSEAVDWDALKDKQPFFQVVNFFHSHESRAFSDGDTAKHDPDKTTIAAYHPDVPAVRKNYAVYHDALTLMDAKVGEALAKLEAHGLAENTIVVYVSDHGGVMPRSKRFLFQNSLHCPFIVRIPEAFNHLYPAESPGSKVDRLVSFVDMPKTWLSLAGAEVPGHMQGRVFLGPEAAPEPEDHFAFRGRMDERVENARAIVTKRYLYIRNYMPYVPWMQRIEYLWRMQASQAWDQSVLEGRATPAQARFFEPKGWTEELYDTQVDPDNVKNLAGDPAYGGVLDEMRSRLRARQLEAFDAGLMPESEMARLAAENNTTKYELVRRPDLYDVSAILDAADMALSQQPQDLESLRCLLDHDHVAMRYWGVVGCFLQNDQAGGLLAIDDESHEVRAMAAWLLVRTGERSRGIEALSQMIREQSYASLTLFNMVVWMGDDGRDLAPLIAEQMSEAKWDNHYKYEQGMMETVKLRFGEMPWVK
ncbi:MAG: sulfatase [Planctomycetota bacterium]